ncbi:VOC family protein [Halosolutus gelatinilyticus]|uniref:VOC family protein n=1 Tax=Halosolutus gelatinilyticus TaxID=2931975 RepID=UPI001FF105E6|nr:VOC family protein [Halosolutus gelatinilyticus]
MTGLSGHHVGLTVTDLDETLAFYRDVLGLEVVAAFGVDGDAFADAVSVDGASARFAHLDADGIRLELVEYDPEAEAAGSPELNRPGTAHVGLAVDDLDAFYEALPDDVPTISEPRTTATGTTILFLRDPEDNLVEILDA